MTKVTANNLKSLTHHRLEVRCRSQKNRTGVGLLIEADETHPLSSCTITIYGEDGQTIIGRFDLAVTSRPITFHEADDLVDSGWGITDFSTRCF